MLSLTCVFLLGFVAYARTGASKMEGFIVGGHLAVIENYPHSVFLSIKCVTNKGITQRWICGASVLNQKILLTAAHCLFTCTHESHIGINLGNENRGRGQVQSTYSFVVHENYNTKISTNDLALLRVNFPLQLNSKVSRVALMRRPPYNELAKVAGWGMIDEISERQSDMLKFVTQQVWDRNDCLRTLSYLARGTFCASAKSKGDYAAQGDSGSALIVRGYIQIGLVSYKLPSVSRNVIVYTDVGYFYDWIKFYSKKLYCVE